MHDGGTGSDDGIQGDVSENIRHIESTPERNSSRNKKPSPYWDVNRKELRVEKILNRYYES